ncbi:MAG TPA: hypothetical protein DEF45_10210 [Rhodopirellula sp.]|nr:hypothetical protein [Rhodopirellula sp.]
MGKNGMTHGSHTSRFNLRVITLLLISYRRCLRFHDRSRLIDGMFLMLVTVPQLGVCNNVFRFDEQIDAVVIAEMEKQQIVGAAIGIIQDSKIVYTRGYGWANLKTNTPVTDETVFNWASNSKPLIAIAALQLVESGRLMLDEPIASYCPQLPPQLRPITSRQLLCHQSGIPHYSNGIVIPSKKRSSSDDHFNTLDDINPRSSIDRFIRSPLLFESGIKTSYSSYAYVLLTAVVQAVGKDPISKQLQNRIIDPLELESFQLDLPANDQVNWTLAYETATGETTEVPDYAHFWKHGAGGYKSNIKDFAKFALALGGSQLINSELTEKMWTRQKTTDGNESVYGLGVLVSDYGKRLKVSHNGSQDETRTRLVIYPHRRHGIVVMCNTQGSEPKAITTAIYSALKKQTLNK